MIDRKWTSRTRIFGNIAVICTALLSQIAIAQTAGPSCTDVLRAVAKLEASARVHVSSRILRGHHPERYSTMESVVLDRSFQVRVLDGTRYGPGRIDRTNGELSRATGTEALAPLGDCAEIADPDPLVRRFDYHGPGWRSDALIQLWVSRESGLPVRALIDAPELILARSLSRPTKPPQVMLKENGQRYLEHFEFRFNVAEVEATAAKYGLIPR